MDDYTLEVVLADLPRGWRVMGFGEGLALSGPKPALDKVNRLIAVYKAASEFLPNVSDCYPADERELQKALDLVQTIPAQKESE